MKFLVVAITLVAAVSAEADADAYYAPYFAPYAYGAYTFGGKSAPCVNAANVPVPCAGAPYAYHGYPYSHTGLFILKFYQNHSNKVLQNVEVEIDQVYKHSFVLPDFWTFSLYRSNVPSLLAIYRCFTTELFQIDFYF